MDASCAPSPGTVSPTPAVEVLGLEKTFVLGMNAVPALRGVSLTVSPGEFVAIMGPSGGGKTTLLNMIGLLDVPTRGCVRIDGRDVSSLSENDRADLRRDKLGFVFQFYNLLPMLTAFENVEIPLNFKGIPTPERNARVQELLGRVGLSGRAHHLPAEMSGGEQQRITIARALANRPSIVLLDEPTGDLDSKTGDEIMELIFRLNREEGTTFIMVTHDPELAMRAQRILVIRDGKFVDEIDPEKRREEQRRAQEAERALEALKSKALEEMQERERQEAENDPAEIALGTAEELTAEPKSTRRPRASSRKKASGSGRASSKKKAVSARKSGRKSGASGKKSARKKTTGSARKSARKKQASKRTKTGEESAS